MGLTEVVGDGDTVVAGVAGDDVLTADEGGLERESAMFSRALRTPNENTHRHVVDPDVGAAVKSDSITTPDVLGVELRDGDVLDNDIVDTTSKTKALAKEDTVLAVTDDGLVALDLDRVQSGLVVADIGGGSVRLVVGAPVVLVDGDLAGGVGAVGSAAGLGSGALGLTEVEGLREDDGIGVGGGEVVLKLLGGGRGDGLAGSTASGLGTVTLRLARNRLGGDDRGGGDEGCAQRSDGRHTWDGKEG